MSYKKIHVDNTTCWRRFHLSWEDTAFHQEHVSIACMHCGVKLFEAKDHPPVTLCREENLMQNLQLSPYRRDDCAFKTVTSTARSQEAAP